MLDRFRHSPQIRGDDRYARRKGFLNDQRRVFIPDRGNHKDIDRRQNSWELATIVSPTQGNRSTFSHKLTELAHVNLVSGKVSPDRKDSSVFDVRPLKPGNQDMHPFGPLQLAQKPKTHDRGRGFPFNLVLPADVVPVTKHLNRPEGVFVKDRAYEL